MSAQIQTIAVDLTSVLPGGDNGGAKIFVLELLPQLAKLAPDTQFILLTHAVSHEELAFLDGENMSRLVVVRPSVKQSLRKKLALVASTMLSHLPSRLKYKVGQAGYRLSAWLKRGRHNTLLRDLGADLLFCPFTAATYNDPEIPTVCTIYDLQYLAYPMFFEASDGAHRYHVFLDACQKATKLAAISGYSRESAIAEGNLSPEAIKTIHLRLAQRIVPTTQNHDVLESLHLTSKRYFLYPANFWKHKNHEMLLTAFGIFCRETLNEEVQLVCTGAPGARQTWLQDAVSRMGLKGRVLFPGFLSHEELGILMTHAHALVFPSLYEGFGLPVIEAMAAGVPVACSNATSLPEVVGDAAILFNPAIPNEIANAFNRLMRDEALRNSLIQKGHARAAFFSDTKRMAQEYWDIFEEASGC